MIHCIADVIENFGDSIAVNHCVQWKKGFWFKKCESSPTQIVLRKDVQLISRKKEMGIQASVSHEY